MSRLKGEALVKDRARRGTVETIDAVDRSGMEFFDRPRTVLIRPPIVASARSINNEAVPAIGLASILGFLRGRGHDVLLIDAIADGLNNLWELPGFPGFGCQGIPFEEILERIPGDAEVIGFSMMFSGEWPVHRGLVRQVRQRFPQALLLAGGEHASALTEYTLRDCPELDLCVRGEGELTFLRILERVRENRDVYEVDGIGYLDGDGHYVERAGLPRIRNIDQLPWPHWPEGYLEKFWQAGKSYGVQSARDMPMMVSRGCPFRCTFCSNTRMWTTRYILRDVDDVIAEIKHWVERYRITAIQLYDLTAITKKKWALAFCQKLQESGLALNWSLPSGTRSEILDEETLGWFKRTGCNYMVYAPETGSSRTLSIINKQISLDNMNQSVRAAKKVGLVIRTNLIIGFPGETRRDVFKTVFYGLKLALWGADEVNINIFSPYPGTEIFQELVDSGQLRVDDTFLMGLTSLNSDFSVINPLTCNRHIGPRELALYRIGFMLSNYALGYLLYPGRILRTFRNLNSEHQASTVFEHRLKDMFAKRRAKKDREKGSR